MHTDARARAHTHTGQLKAAKEGEQALQARLAAAASELADVRGEAQLLRSRLDEAQAQARRFREVPAPSMAMYPPALLASGGACGLALIASSLMP